MSDTNDASRFDGAASFCLKNTTWILPFACKESAGNVCSPWGVSLLPPTGGNDWVVSSAEVRAPVTMPPGYFPWANPQPAAQAAKTFGGSNEPACNTQPTAVVAKADDIPVKAAGATTIYAPGMLRNDDVPWDCMPLGECTDGAQGAATAPSMVSPTGTITGNGAAGPRCKACVLACSIKHTGWTLQLPFLVGQQA
jgi:hypothetical protein